MTRIMAVIVLTAASYGASADPDKHGCGWGSLVFEGQSGLVPYVLASTTNGILGNATFGMTSGTNGCQTHHPIPYGGKSWFAAADFADDIIEDIAQGNGEALKALAIMIGIYNKDRDYFYNLTHENFAVIAPSSEITGEEVMASIEKLLESDPILSAYI